MKEIKKLFSLFTILTMFIHLEVLSQSSGGIPDEFMYDITSRNIGKRITNPALFMEVEKQEV